MRILLLSQANQSSEAYRSAFRSIGYECEFTDDLNPAVILTADQEFDAIVIDSDRSLQHDRDMIYRLRRSRQQTPIMVLSTHDCVTHRVTLLDAGVDDVVKLPIHVDELCARLRAIMRRCDSSISSKLTCGDLEMDLFTQNVRRGRRQIQLTRREFALLEFLLRQGGRVLSRSTIFDHVWNGQTEAQSNVVDAYIRLLRKKVDSEADTPLIHTVIGMGYTLRSTQLSL